MWEALEKPGLRRKCYRLRWTLNTRDCWLGATPTNGGISTSTCSGLLIRYREVGDVMLMVVVVIVVVAVVFVLLLRGSVAGYELLDDEDNRVIIL
jgi:hypothetical protein